MVKDRSPTPPQLFFSAKNEGKPALVSPVPSDEKRPRLRTPDGILLADKHAETSPSPSDKPPSTGPGTMVLNSVATLIVIALVLGWWLSH